MTTGTTTRKRLRAVSLIATAAAVAAAGLLAPIASADPAAEELSAQALTQAAERRQRLIELRQIGATDAEIESRLGLVRISQDEPAGTGPLSENTAVTVYTPTVYFDRGINAYYAAADFRWKDQTTGGDGGRGHVGGEDGLGVRFSRDVRNAGTTASFCPGAWSGDRPLPSTKPACISPPPSDNTPDGSVFRYRDRREWKGDNAIYVGANGTLVHTFRRLGAGCIQIFSRYAHTWRKTAITSVSLSNSGLTFNFSLSDSRWQVTSSNSAKVGC